MRHRRRGLATLISAVACSVLACGKVETVSPNGSAASGGPGGAGASAGTGGGGTTAGTAGVDPNVIVPTTIVELCEKLPGARGTFMARCYGGDPEEWGWLFDRPCAAVGVSEEAGRITLNQERVVACFTALAAEACSPQEVRKVSVACDGLITGSIPTGGSCNALGFGDECEPAAVCENVLPCTGTCAPRGVVGETCHGMYVYTVCGAGLECDAVSAECRVPGAEGDACMSWQGVCQPGLHCDAVDQEQGTCRPDQTDGPCTRTEDCAAPFRCVQDDSGGGTCVRAKLVGEACTFGLRECQSYCSPEGFCRVAAQEGEECGSLADTAGTRRETVTCGAGLFCNRESDRGLEGICRNQVPIGTTCPQTSASGNPCRGDDALSYCDAYTDACATCD